MYLLQICRRLLLPVNNNIIKEAQEMRDPAKYHDINDKMQPKPSCAAAKTTD